MPDPTTPAARGTITPPLDTAKARKALTFFRVMAVVVGIGLLLLVLEMVLYYGFDNDVLTWWAQPHGFLFIVYIVATANLGFAVGWGLGRMVLIMLAGCVPFLSFWAEHRVVADVQGRLQAAEAESGQPASRAGTASR